MARRQVLEVTCDRCKKTETQEVDASPATEAAELEITFHGNTIKYDDLCKRCRRACMNYYNKITKQDDEEDAKAEKEGAEVPGQPKSFLGGIGKKAG